MTTTTNNTPSPFASISTQALHQQLQTSQDICIVTANQRLSRFRLTCYEQTQLKQEQHAWITPRILPWSAWLNAQWQQSNQGLWLSKQQETLLWRNCITEDTSTHVLNPHALSKQAMDAWKILADYHIDTTCLQHGGEEHDALWRWGQTVEANTTHTLQHQVLARLTKIAAHHTQNTIILDGFDTFTPAQHAYLQHLNHAGFHIFEVHNTSKTATMDITNYPDEESELRQTCHRIRLLQTEHPTYSIGIFFPNLEQRAATVSRIFTEELAPALSLQNNAEQQGDYFNISVGSTLAKQPMIQGALMLLSLTIRHQLQHQDLSQLLLSPYVAGYTDEIHHRALLDFKLRQNNQNHLTLAQIVQLAQHASQDTPLLQQTLSHIISQQQSLTGRQVLSYWIILADKFLHQLSWHEQASSPHEYAQQQGWEDLIHQLTSLDDFTGLISWAEAITRLQEHAHEQLFRPAPGQAQVQVMGLLEVANLHFDAAFILGMDNSTWPAIAKPHPLIPFNIQVLHQTPHANSEREWLYAQKIWQHIQHVTPNLHISYSKIKAGQEVHASALLDDQMSIKSGGNPTSFRYANDLQLHPASMQSINNMPRPIMTHEEIRGGTGILKSQSACAFQAFAQHRLHIRNLETPSQGLNTREQGTLLHAALENFWNHTQTHASLLSLIQMIQLDNHITIAIDDAWTSLNRFIPMATKKLETQRLQGLLKAWLTFESKRSPFKVKGCEVWRDIHLGTATTLTLHTKLDRIDIDTEGHHIILDYKTGESSAGKAMGERPDEPQLPAYLLAEQALHTTVDALAFAQVRNESIGYKGFASASDILPTIKAFKGKKNEPENWETLTATWQDTLNNLADEFMRGEAPVTPKNTQTCHYCKFQGLCRIATIAEHTSDL